MFEKAATKKDDHNHPNSLQTKNEWTAEHVEQLRNSILKEMLKSARAEAKVKDARLAALERRVGEQERSRTNAAAGRQVVGGGRPPRRD